MIGYAIACEKVTRLSLALARGGLANENWYMYSQLEQMQQIRPGMANEDGVAQGVSYVYLAG